MGRCCCQWKPFHTDMEISGFDKLERAAFSRSRYPGGWLCMAPEVVYDRKRENYFIFFASNVREAGEAESKQRIYFTKTKDF